MRAHFFIREEQFFYEATAAFLIQELPDASLRDIVSTVTLRQGHHFWIALEIGTKFAEAMTTLEV
jgi:hypothetical protein